MVRILHLSDLHFALDAQAENMQTVLLREAAAVRALPRKEKLLIVTGDFHNFKDSDYGKAEEFLNKLFAAMDIDPAEGVFIIPGNHDVGNDKSLKEQMEAEPHWKRLQKSALEDLKKEQPEDWQDSLNLRLECYKPYCDFVRRLGIYPAGDDLQPARVHVRCWDGRLNILHLNTTLIYEPKQYGNQKLDAAAAAGEEIWRGFDPALPTLALGHNSYYDLCEKHRHQLRVPFLSRNVSAYLCGDTHQKEYNPEHQTIPLEANQLDGVRIPNIVCAKVVSDENDEYSDFGFYRHDWDTETDTVTFRFRRWRLEYGAETQPDGKADSYPLRRPGETKTKPAAAPTPHAQTREPDALCRYLGELLEQVRREHPSFKLMKPDEIDERLFPGAVEVQPFEAKGTETGDKTPRPVWERIRESWQGEENRSIVIEGDGGIGKTVTLLSPPADLPAPAVYIRLYEMVKDGKCLSMTDWLRANMLGCAEALDRLAMQPWDGGPALLLLLDGVNEVPAAKQRELLHLLNDWSTHHPGAQLIAVSRPLDGLNLVKEMAGNPIGIELEPLSEETVADYLRGQGSDAPADWEILRRPLFLTLYAKTGRITQTEAEGYPLAFRAARSRGTILWNYLQRELLRVPSEEWVLSCAVACETILPRIAYEMLERHVFTIEQSRAFALIEEAVSGLDPARLPKHLAQLWRRHRRTKRKNPDVSNTDWGDLVLDELGLLLLQPEHEDEAEARYAFPHQNFRDCLAGVHLVNAAEEIREKELPEVWRQTPNHLALDYAAELMEEETAKTLWEANRVRKPTEHAAVCAQLELHRRRAGEPMALDFSGMDLRGLSLTRYGSRGQCDLKLFRDSALSMGTRLDLDTFRGLGGHTDSVGCVAATADGLAVSGSVDNSLRVWDLRTGACLHELKGHTGPVNCVAATADSLAVSSSYGNTLRVWDLHSGACLHVLKGHNHSVNCVAATADGLAVSGSGDGTLRVWDLRSGACLHELKGHTGPVSCVAATADGLAVSGSSDKTLRVWDLHSGACLHELKGHTGSVYCVAVTADGRAVSGSYDETLRVWDLRSGACLHVLKGHNHSVNCVAVTADDLAVSGSDDNTLRVWDLRSGACLHELEGHTNWVRCVAATADGLAVSGSWDNTLRVWDLRSGACLHELKGHTLSVDCVAATADGLAVSGSDDSTLRVWDLRTGAFLHELKGHSDTVRCVAVTGDGLAVSGSRDKTLRVWDLRTGAYLHELKGHTDSVRCVAATADGLAVSGSYDETLRVWDLRTGACLHVLKGHTGSVYCVEVTADGLAVSGSYDKTLRIWDLRTGACLHELKGHTGPVSCVAATADGLAVSGSWDFSLRVWDIRSGAFLHEMKGHTNAVNCVAVTADGLAVSGSADSTLRVWDLRSGVCLHELEGHTDWVRCVAVTADGLAVSGSDDKTLRVWDLRTGACLHKLEGHTGSVYCVAATADGLAVSGSWDGTLRVWDICAGTCLDVLRALPDIDVRQMDFSRAILDKDTARTLRQNGAKLSDAETRRQETKRKETAAAT